MPESKPTSAPDESMVSSRPDDLTHYMQATSRLRAALDELLAWTSRMPDALLGPEDPRWAWWTEGALIRQKARNALRPRDWKGPSELFEIVRMACDSRCLESIEAERPDPCPMLLCICDTTDEALEALRNLEEQLESAQRDPEETERAREEDGKRPAGEMESLDHWLEKLDLAGHIHVRVADVRDFLRQVSSPAKEPS